jgi:hypothetical protein
MSIEKTRELTYRAKRISANSATIRFRAAGEEDEAAEDDEEYAEEIEEDEGIELAAVNFRKRKDLAEEFCD